jgi:plastocyanin
MNKYLGFAFSAVVLIAIIIAGYLILNGKNHFNQSTLNQAAKQAAGKKVNIQNIPAQTITLTSSGFMPQTLTITVNTRVIWENQSGTQASVNSDNYPTNLLYPFLNFGQFNNGSSFSTIFQKTGTYTYYNFYNKEQRGTVIVK